MKLDEDNRILEFAEKPKEFELPNLNEIPEVKNSDPVMEIL